MSCSSYRALNFQILKVKQRFQSKGYLQSFVNCCTKMYLDEPFMKHPNMSIVAKKKKKKGIRFVFFSILGKKSLEIKKRLQNAIEFSSKIINHFHVKDVLPKKLYSVAWFIVLSVTLFLSCNSIYRFKLHLYLLGQNKMPFLRQSS